MSSQSRYITQNQVFSFLTNNGWKSSVGDAYCFCKTFENKHSSLTLRAKIVRHWSKIVIQLYDFKVEFDYSIMCTIEFKRRLNNIVEFLFKN